METHLTEEEDGGHDLSALYEIVKKRRSKKKK